METDSAQFYNRGARTTTKYCMSDSERTRQRAPQWRSSCIPRDSVTGSLTAPAAKVSKINHQSPTAVTTFCRDQLRRRDVGVVGRGDKRVVLSRFLCALGGRYFYPSCLFVNRISKKAVLYPTEFHGGKTYKIFHEYSMRFHVKYTVELPRKTSCSMIILRSIPRAFHGISTRFHVFAPPPIKFHGV